MIFTAYSPIARGAVLDDPLIKRIAKEKGVTPAQVVLRWDIQQENVVTIPKSITPERIRTNFDVFTFTLSGSEMAAITALSQSHKLRVRQSGRRRAGLGRLEPVLTRSGAPSARLER